MTMTQEQKAKAYDEAIDKVAHFIKKHIGLGCTIHPNSSEAKELFNIFPELKESEDERIRKAIRLILIATEDDQKDFYETHKLTRKELTDWLEKQQKPTDKVEPKFKVGDWILYSGDGYEGVRHITKINENGYYIERNGLPHGIIPFNHEICMRLWTIQDAKDGDVLTYNDSKNNVWVCIFKEYANERVYDYCTLDKESFWERGNWNYLASFSYIPATKEQRDLLFQKMREAGYTFDFEKKELKKIEFDACINWLKSLRPQPKQEWSEEDEESILEICNYLDRLVREDEDNLATQLTVQELKDWLKSIRPQNKWKPSDEQMNDLKKAIDSFTFETDYLQELYEDLKKLKRE